MVHTTPVRPHPPADPKRLSQAEFVGMLAFLFATVAFSIDAMLPALPRIAQELTPDDVNHAQLILTAFMAGLGTGTALSGPISDAIGRRPTILIGLSIYILASFAALAAPSLEILLLLRFLQGLGASGPRIAGTALVRDLFAGREMARITSFVMMIFIMVPALAPSIGALVMDWGGGWRAVFVAFIAFGCIGASWYGLRQPETLPPAYRRKLVAGDLIAAAREVFSHRQIMLATLVLTLGFGQMFALLSSAQQLFGETFGRAESFPQWFAAMALLSGTSSVLNAKFVMHFGMRRIARMAYLMQVASSTLALIFVAGGVLEGDLAFYGFFAWAVSVFFMAGVTFGNLNALAMQNMPHLAGMTASLVSAMSTIGAVLIAAPVGLAYDGTSRPIMIATLVCSGLAWVLMARLKD